MVGSLRNCGGGPCSLFLKLIVITSLMIGTLSTSGDETPIGFSKCIAAMFFTIPSWNMKGWTGTWNISSHGVVPKAEVTVDSDMSRLEMNYQGKYELQGAPCNQDCSDIQIIEKFKFYSTFDRKTRSFHLKENCYNDDRGIDIISKFSHKNCDLGEGRVVCWMEGYQYTFNPFVVENKSRRKRDVDIFECVNWDCVSSIMGTFFSAHMYAKTVWCTHFALLGSRHRTFNETNAEVFSQGKCGTLTPTAWQRGIDFDMTDPDITIYDGVTMKVENDIPIVSQLHLGTNIIPVIMVDHISSTTMKSSGLKFKMSMNDSVIQRQMARSIITRPTCMMDIVTLAALGNKDPAMSNVISYKPEKQGNWYIHKTMRSCRYIGFVNTRGIALDAVPESGIMIRAYHKITPSAYYQGVPFCEFDIPCNFDMTDMDNTSPKPGLDLCDSQASKYKVDKQLVISHKDDNGTSMNMGTGLYMRDFMMSWEDVCHKDRCAFSVTSKPTDSGVYLKVTSKSSLYLKATLFGQNVVEFSGKQTAFINVGSYKGKVLPLRGECNGQLLQEDMEISPREFCKVYCSFAFWPFNSLCFHYSCMTNVFPALCKFLLAITILRWMSYFLANMISMSIAFIYVLLDTVFFGKILCKNCKSFWCWPKPIELNDAAYLPWIKTLTSPHSSSRDKVLAKIAVCKEAGFVFGRGIRIACLKTKLFLYRCPARVCPLCSEKVPEKMTLSNHVALYCAVMDIYPRIADTVLAKKYFSYLDDNEVGENSEVLFYFLDLLNEVDVFKVLSASSEFCMSSSAAVARLVKRLTERSSFWSVIVKKYCDCKEKCMWNYWWWYDSINWMVSVLYIAVWSSAIVVVLRSFGKVAAGDSCQTDDIGFSDIVTMSFVSRNIYSLLRGGFHYLILTLVFSLGIVSCYVFLCGDELSFMMVLLILSASCILTNISFQLLWISNVGPYINRIFPLQALLNEVKRNLSVFKPSVTRSTIIFSAIVIAIQLIALGVIAEKVFMISDRPLILIAVMMIMFTFNHMRLTLGLVSHITLGSMILTIAPTVKASSETEIKETYNTLYLSWPLAIILLILKGFNHIHIRNNRASDYCVSICNLLAFFYVSKQLLINGVNDATELSMAMITTCMVIQYFQFDNIFAAISVMLLSLLSPCVLTACTALILVSACMSDGNYKIVILSLIVTVISNTLDGLGDKRGTIFPMITTLGNVIMSFFSNVENVNGSYSSLFTRFMRKGHPLIYVSIGIMSLVKVHIWQDEQHYLVPISCLFAFIVLIGNVKPILEGEWSQMVRLLYSSLLLLLSTQVCHEPLLTNSLVVISVSTLAWCFCENLIAHHIVLVVVPWVVEVNPVLVLALSSVNICINDLVTHVNSNHIETEALADMLLWIPIALTPLMYLFLGGDEWDTEALHLAIVWMIKDIIYSTRVNGVSFTIFRETIQRVKLGNCIKTLFLILIILSSILDSTEGSSIDNLQSEEIDYDQVLSNSVGREALVSHLTSLGYTSSKENILFPEDSQYYPMTYEVQSHVNEKEVGILSFQIPLSAGLSGKSTIKAAGANVEVLIRVVESRVVFGTIPLYVACDFDRKYVHWRKCFTADINECQNIMDTQVGDEDYVVSHRYEQTNDKTCRDECSAYIFAHHYNLICSILSVVPKIETCRVVSRISSQSISAKVCISIGSQIYCKRYFGGGVSISGNSTELTIETPGHSEMPVGTKFVVKEGSIISGSMSEPGNPDHNYGSNQMLEGRASCVSVNPETICGVPVDSLGRGDTLMTDWQESCFDQEGLLDQMHHHSGISIREESTWSDPELGELYYPSELHTGDIFLGQVDVRFIAKFPIQRQTIVSGNLESVEPIDCTGCFQCDFPVRCEIAIKAFNPGIYTANCDEPLGQVTMIANNTDTVKIHIDFHYDKKQLKITCGVSGKTFILSATLDDVERTYIQEDQAINARMSAKGDRSVEAKGLTGSGLSMEGINPFSGVTGFLEVLKVIGIVLIVIVVLGLTSFLLFKLGFFLKFLNMVTGVSKFERMNDLGKRVKKLSKEDKKAAEEEQANKVQEYMKSENSKKDD